jgi:hypothetical protein
VVKCINTSNMDARLKNKKTRGNKMDKGKRLA